MAGAKDGLSGEIQAMSVIEGALEPLEEDVRRRVLRWAAERFGVVLAPEPSPRGGARSPQQETDTSGGTEEYEALADLYAAAAPKTEADRALVAGYWFQYVQGESELEGARVNKELKQLGHGVANITRAFDGLKAKTPALVMQTRKSGSTKQARKKYKLTNAGKQEVERMLAGPSE
ncbi:MAG TPA: hypothetical protein ENK02_01075 [Planctomycetes bacterium]|nr:hypothetical protein [Planctomycetota bacterium]